MSIEFTFWPAPVKERSFEDQLKAAGAGGFHGFAISPNVFFQNLERGLAASDMQAMAQDHGVSITRLDTLTTWGPMQLRGELDDELYERWSISLDDGLRVCEELGLQSILACAAYHKDAVPLTQLIDGFGRLCERAATIGTSVDLEPMPFFGCDNVAAAWDIVGGAAQPNSGILLDTWHFYKAPGQTLNAIAAIPGQYFQTVQITDGYQQQICETQSEDTIRNRLFCGDGELAVTDFIDAVYRKGGLKSIGPEVFTDTTLGQDASEVGRYAGRTSLAALERANVPLTEIDYVVVD